MRAQLEINTQAIDLQTTEQKLMAQQMAEAGQAADELCINQRRRQES